MSALAPLLAPTLAAFAASLAAAAALAQYPAKPIRLIVPFAAGGGNDSVARLVGKRLSDGLGQPLVVDNRPGAGGVLGAELAAKAAAGGYTLFLGGGGSHAINPNLSDCLPYDPIRDFAPVALLAQAPLVLVVHPSVPADSFKAFVALVRSKPGQLNYASNGNGSSSHLAAVMFDSMTGVDMAHVPYKGLSPALADLLSGRVQLMFSSRVAILPHITSEKLRRLAASPDSFPGCATRRSRAKCASGRSSLSSIRSAARSTVRISHGAGSCNARSRSWTAPPRAACGEPRNGSRRRTRRSRTARRSRGSSWTTSTAKACCMWARSCCRLSWPSRSSAG